MIFNLFYFMYNDCSSMIVSWITAVIHSRTHHQCNVTYTLNFNRMAIETQVVTCPAFSLVGAHRVTLPNQGNKYNHIEYICVCVCYMQFLKANSSNCFSRLIGFTLYIYIYTYTQREKERESE